MYSLGENGVELLPGLDDYITAGGMKKLALCNQTRRRRSSHKGTPG